MTLPNQSAFPETEYYNEQLIGGSEGLTKREYFAAKALAGLTANQSFIDSCAQIEREYQAAGKEVNSGYLIAKSAVSLADELIKALSHKNNDV